MYMYMFLCLTDRLSRPEKLIFPTKCHGVRATQEPNKMHLHFFTFSCSFCPCAGPKPKTSPEAAMGDGVGPLNEALESVTTERVGVLSQTHTDPSQYLNFFRFSTCYEVVPLIQHPVLGPPQQAISTALHTKSRIPSETGKDYHSRVTTA